jgi:hypothetical protein
MSTPENIADCDSAAASPEPGFAMRAAPYHRTYGISRPYITKLTKLEGEDQLPAVEVCGSVWILESWPHYLARTGRPIRGKPVTRKAAAE